MISIMSKRYEVCFQGLKESPSCRGERVTSIPFKFVDELQPINNQNPPSFQKSSSIPSLLRGPQERVRYRLSTKNEQYEEQVQCNKSRPEAAKTPEVSI